MTLAMAASMMMLMLAVVRSRRSTRTTSKPSMPGSITSQRSRSGAFALASSSPSSPSPRHQATPGHDLRRFQSLLREVSGLELPETRRPDLQRAVNRALTATGLADTDALYRHLREGADRPALEAFVGDLTIGETHFFRNRPQFRALERHILPELIERRRDSRRLPVWSAACSTGEEASCVVAGMPAAAVAAGAVDQIVPLDELGARIAAAWSPSC